MDKKNPVKVEECRDHNKKRKLEVPGLQTEKKEKQH